MFNIHIIYLTLPYILQTHSLQTIYTYSYIYISNLSYKHHISQNIYISYYLHKS